MNPLKIYLIINAIFSNLCAWIMISLSGGLNDFFAIDNQNVFPIIGAVLLIFSAFVYYVSAKKLDNKLLVNLIILMDVFWVVGSIIILVFNLFDLSNTGRIIIAIVAVWIGFLGLKQYQNNKIIH